MPDLVSLSARARRSPAAARVVAVAVAAFVAAAVAVAAGGRAQAHSYGAPSPIFRETRPASCNGCHRGGAAPAVTVAASTRQLAAATPVVLTVTVTTPNGNPGAAGFDLRASRAGQFALGGPASEATMIVRGANGRSEATHKAPKAARQSGEPVVFTVLWTPGAGVTGRVTFTAWGNAVDGNIGNDGPLGDRATRATTDVVVGSAVGRGR